MDNDIVQVKFSFPVPKDIWLANFSIKYHLLHFNVLSALILTENQGSCLIQIKGINIDDFWNEFSTQYKDGTFQMIYKDVNSLLMHILIQDPWILQNIVTAQLLVRFPLVIFKGSVSIELIAPRNKIEKLFNNPKWKEMNVSIKQIGQYCPDSLLSHKQTDVLICALKKGYFDVPRKQSLSSLATELGISPTALSENLRRITKKLGEYYINCIHTSENG